MSDHTMTFNRAFTHLLVLKGTSIEDNYEIPVFNGEHYLQVKVEKINGVEHFVVNQVTNFSSAGDGQVDFDDGDCFHINNLGTAVGIGDIRNCRAMHGQGHYDHIQAFLANGVKIAFQKIGSQRSIKWFVSDGCCSQANCVKCRKTCTQTPPSCTYPVWSPEEAR